MNRFYDNAAYDFENFAPKKNEAKVIRLPENRNRHRSSQSAGLKSKLKIGAVAAIVLTLIVIQIHGQIKNSEVCAQINAANEQITALKQEESRLNVELSSIVSFNNIENAAKEKGMQKATGAQTGYINICDEDSVEVAEDNKNIFEKIADLF